MTAEVRIDASWPQRLLGANSGPGARLLQRKAERVAALARVYAAPHGSIATGIIVGPVVDKSIKVVSTHPATIWVNSGTRPHEIKPRRRGGVLRFEIGGTVVYARRVMHPGNRASRFMERSLRDAG